MTMNANDANRLVDARNSAQWLAKQLYELLEAEEMPSSTLLRRLQSQHELLGRELKALTCRNCDGRGFVVAGADDGRCTNVEIDCPVCAGRPQHPVFGG